MQRNGVTIDDTFAEAFPMKGTRLLITAHDLTWARHAAASATGFAAPRGASTKWRSTDLVNCFTCARR